MFGNTSSLRRGPERSHLYSSKQSAIEPVAAPIHAAMVLASSIFLEEYT